MLKHVHFGLHLPENSLFQLSSSHLRLISSLPDMVLFFLVQLNSHTSAQRPSSATPQQLHPIHPQTASSYSFLLTFATPRCPTNGLPSLRGLFSSSLSPKWLLLQQPSGKVLLRSSAEVSAVVRAGTLVSSFVYTALHCILYSLLASYAEMHWQCC